MQSAHAPPPPPPPSPRPPIEVLGTFDLVLVETTPVIFQGELWLFESVRKNYWNSTPQGPGGLQPHMRFVNVKTGEKSSVFGIGHFFGSAIVEGDTVFAYGTKGDTGDSPGAGENVTVFWSSDMQTWRNRTALNLGKSKRNTWNTSVGKGKINGTTCYAMSFDVRNPKTPGAWNQQFAVSHDLLTWTPLDTGTFGMPADVEHGDAALRYSQGYWYSITGRMSPGPGRLFITEIFRSKDLTIDSWEPGEGMGLTTGPGRPLMRPCVFASRFLFAPTLLTSRDARLMVAGTPPPTKRLRPASGTPTCLTCCPISCSFGRSEKTATRRTWTSSSTRGRPS